MAGATNPLTCSGCGRTFNSPAIGATGEAVCPTCGAPIAAGPAPDDTAAFQRFYAATPPAPSGWRAWVARLLGRS